MQYFIFIESTFEFSLKLYLKLKFKIISIKETKIKRDCDYFESGGGGGGWDPSRDLLELVESSMCFSRDNEDMGFDLFDDGGSPTILAASTTDSTRAPAAAMDDLLESLSLYSASKKIKSTVIPLLHSI